MRNTVSARQHLALLEKYDRLTAKCSDLETNTVSPKQHLALLEKYDTLTAKYDDLQAWLQPWFRQWNVYAQDADAGSSGSTNDVRTIARVEKRDGQSETTLAEKKLNDGSQSGGGGSSGDQQGNTKRKRRRRRNRRQSGCKDADAKLATHPL